MSECKHGYVIMREYPERSCDLCRAEKAEARVAELEAHLKTADEWIAAACRRIEATASVSTVDEKAQIVAYVRKCAANNGALVTSANPDVRWRADRDARMFAFIADSIERGDHAPTRTGCVATEVCVECKKPVEYIGKGRWRCNTYECDVLDQTGPTPKRSTER